MTSTVEFNPPMLNGVTASKVFLQATSDSSKTVYAYLCAQFPHIESSEWQSRFNNGLVYDAQGNTLSIESSFSSEYSLFYYRFWHTEVHVPFQHQILFENEHLLVVDKPHFLTMSPTGQYVQETLLVRLKQQTEMNILLRFID